MWRAPATARGQNAAVVRGNFARIRVAVAVGRTGRRGSWRAHRCCLLHAPQPGSRSISRACGARSAPALLTARCRCCSTWKSATHALYADYLQEAAWLAGGASARDRSGACREPAQRDAAASRDRAARRRRAVCVIGGLAAAGGQISLLHLVGLLLVVAVGSNVAVLSTGAAVPMSPPTPRAAARRRSRSRSRSDDRGHFRCTGPRHVPVGRRGARRCAGAGLFSHGAAPGSRRRAPSSRCALSASVSRMPPPYTGCCRRPL